MSSFVRRHLPVAAVLAVSALPCVVAYAVVAGRMAMVPGLVHLLGMTGAALLAGIAAAGLSVLAARRHDGRAVLLGAGFSVMAVLLIVHGLATPGQIIGENSVVSLAGGLNLPAGGVVLAASALPALRRPKDVDALLLAQAVVVAVLVLVGGVFLADPGLVPTLPPPGTGPADLLMVIGGASLLLLAWRAARTHRLTRRPADLIVAIGATWLAGALYGLLYAGMMDAAFWVAHVLEVSGIAMVGIPAALDLRAASASRPLVGDLAADELVAGEERFLGARVHALLVRLAEKDPSTELHTRSVAALAVRLGERLGLPADRLRLLALGGLLHDMGKLSVPDRILRKPGRLDDDEFAVIRRHPVWGRELLVELGGFPPLVLDLVHGHHERLDGGGYPSGRAADELALEVRILAVADVYDALTADRVYRDAWSAERALALLEEESGSAFDPQCVAALKDVVGGPLGWRLGLAEPAAPSAVKNGALKARPA
jgi:HD-GYP domain-containing protein (c-di-GMP phosphodiesterase class II)